MCFCGCVVPLYLLCSLELGLPWDPLAASYREMALAQRSLTQPWCAGDKEGRRGKEESGNAIPWREEFNADDLVKAFGGSHLVLGSSQVFVMHKAEEEPSNDKKLSHFLLFVSEEEYDDVLPTGILQRGRAGDHHPNLSAGSNLM